MTTDMDDVSEEFETMYRRWLGDLSKLGQKWMAELQEGLQKHVDALMGDAFSPQVFMDFIRNMGVDLSQLSQMFGRMAQTGSMPGFDPYVILGLDRSASDEQVKRAYREVMMHIHPDRAGKVMTFLASLVNAAYQAICKERGI